VGGNRSRVLGKRLRTKAPSTLLDQLLLFLATQFSPGPISWVANDKEGMARQ
jgi:hypothetical protein